VGAFAGMRVEAPGAGFAASNSEGRGIPVRHQFCLALGGLSAIIAPDMGEAKRKNQQACPALGRTISRIECASGRNSLIACPLDCPQNPFAPGNYLTVLSGIEGRVISEISRLYYQDQTPAEKQELERASRARDVFGANSLATWKIHGCGAAARWDRDGLFSDLRNDERVVLQCLMTTRPALLEIQRQVNNVSCLARNLLRPDDGERLVLDAAMSRNATRYGTHLTWLYEVPGAWRISGVGLPVPTLLPRGPDEVLMCLLEHLGAPVDERERWLFEHMSLVARALTAVAEARRPGGGDAPAALVPKCLLEQPSPSALQRFPVADSSGATADEYAKAYLAIYEDFANRPLSGLIGASPRAAAADPALRPLLVKLMKLHASTCDNERRRGIDVDINDVFADLGLEEWIQPAVPLGEFEEAAEQDVDGDADEPWDGNDDVTLNLEPCIQIALTGEEVMDRINDFGLAAGLFTQLAAQWQDLCAILDEMRLDTLNVYEYAALVHAVLGAAGILHPRRPSRVVPNQPRTLRKMALTMSVLADRLERGDEFYPVLEKLFLRSPQPEVCSKAVGLLIAEVKHSGGGRCRPEPIAIASVALEVIIWELTHWPPSPRWARNRD